MVVTGSGEKSRTSETRRFGAATHGMRRSMTRPGSRRGSTRWN